MKNTMNVSPGNNRAVKMVVNFHCLSGSIEVLCLRFWLKASSHGTHEYEDQNDRFLQVTTVCWREESEQLEGHGHDGHIKCLDT